MHQFRQAHRNQVPLILDSCLESQNSCGRNYMKDFDMNTQSFTPLKVGVLMGGRSLENEVSFNSGRTVCDHLDSRTYSVVPIFQTLNGDLYILPLRFLHRGKISDFEHRLATEAERIDWEDLKTHVDFMYLATHGKYMEDGCTQSMLEMLQIPYLGSNVFGSALGMHKPMQQKILRAAGIEVPQSITLTPKQIQQFIDSPPSLEELLVHNNLTGPLVVKPCFEGSSLGISMVENIEQLPAALEHASLVDERRAQSVIVEEKIIGMEFTCIILTDKHGKPLPLPPTEVVHEAGSALFDYEQKYMPGRAHKFTPARVSPEMITKIQETCVRAMSALEITNVGRIDGFVREDGSIVIIDPNSLSGMGPSFFLFRQAAEIDMGHTELFNHLIETELRAYGMDTVIKHIENQRENTDTQQLRVGVLFGGRSNEREISLESGRNIIYKLSPNRYEVLPIFLSSSLELYHVNQRMLVANSTQEIEDALTPSMKISWRKLKEHVDFAFIGLHGGEGENGTVQGTLELLDIPYNGSGVLTSALCMDKFKTNAFMESHGFEVPRGMLMHKDSWDEQARDLIAALGEPPYIVKPYDDGCSVMVNKAKTIELAQNIAQEMYASGKEKILIEECVTGMELTVGVIGNEDPIALIPSQAVCIAGILSIEEKFLPGAGENQTPPPLPDDTINFIRSTVANWYRTLGCKGYARIDCFYQSAEESITKKERLIFIEANTLPGMTPATCIFHQAAELGIRPMDFIDMIVELGMLEHAAGTTSRTAPSIEQLMQNKMLPTKNPVI